jgi:hypothetical protein
LKGDLAQATANAEQFVRNTDDRYRYLGQLTLARVALYRGSLGGALDDRPPGGTAWPFT